MLKNFSYFFKIKWLNNKSLYFLKKKLLNYFIFLKHGITYFYYGKYFTIKWQNLLYFYKRYFKKLWYYSVGVVLSNFIRNPIYFMDFSFLKSIFIQLSNPFWLNWVDLIGSTVFIQSIYTPKIYIKMQGRTYTVVHYG
jgi:hypothetical protein